MIRPITSITFRISDLFIQCGSTVDKAVQTSTNGWTKDQNGCMHIRSKEIANKLLSDNSLMNNSKEAFLKIFGSPNERTSENGSDILIYYWSTVCEGAKLIANCDKCYAKFYFEDDKLTSTGFPCE